MYKRSNSTKKYNNTNNTTRYNNTNKYSKFNKYNKIDRAIGNPKAYVHYFKRTVVLPPIQVMTAGNPITGSYAFKLSDLPNFEDFKNLYDQYKIKGVKISFIPISNVVVGIAGGATGHPGTYYSNRLFTAVDYNDGTAPASVNALREYQNSKWTPYNKIHSRYIKPAYASVPSSGSSLQWPGGSQPWVPTDNDNMYYFGIKYGIDYPTGVGAPALGDLLYQVEATYYMSFKGPR